MSVSNKSTVEQMSVSNKSTVEQMSKTIDILSRTKVRVEQMYQIHIHTLVYTVSAKSIGGNGGKLHVHFRRKCTFILLLNLCLYIVIKCIHYVVDCDHTNLNMHVLKNTSNFPSFTCKI